MPLKTSDGHARKASEIFHRQGRGDAGSRLAAIYQQKLAAQAQAQVRSHYAYYQQLAAPPAPAHGTPPAPAVPPPAAKN